MQDDLLIQSLGAGDRSAIQHLVETYKNRVYNTILGMVQNAEDAEELAQDVFVKAIQNAAKFKGDSTVGTWLYRIAVNTSLDHIKMKKRKKRFAFWVSINDDSDDKPSIDIADFVHPGVQMENKESAKALFAAINRLPEKQKTALVLNKVEGLSYEQTAKVMETSLASIESLLFRAKQNLKKLLENYYKNEL
jgi:RNA polymerase sigma-70 factor (ECF subfamily)